MYKWFEKSSVLCFQTEISVEMRSHIVHIVFKAYEHNLG